MVSLLRRARLPLPQADGPALPLDFHQGDAFGALGMRGTGKTTLAKELYKANMRAFPDICGYVIDSNATGDFTGWSGAHFGYHPPIIRPSKTGRQVIWQPPNDDYNAYEDFFDRLFWSVMQTGVGAAVFIDELSCLGHGKHAAYARILKRGRKRRNFPGISMFSVSQEFAQKADTPRQTFTQITHFAKFYVQHPYDLQEANRLLHLDTHIQPAHQHGFWIARLDKPPLRPAYHAGLQEIFGGSYE